jgi:hypothetical protein
MKPNTRFLIFLLFLFVLNVLQATFTELLPDEAYYYIYSTHLDWGYFDHPPFVALLTFIGSWLGKGTLFFRLPFLLLNAASIFIVYKILKPLNTNYFIWLILSIVGFTAMAFWAVPDSPLMFFVALFFYLYQKFLQKATVLNSTFLGLCIALMFYSKYHAVLVVFFTVLSNLNLFKQKYFYIVLLTSMLFFLPHIQWQISHNYPSLNYHLNYRFNKGFDVMNVLNYVGSQFAMTGIIFFWVFLLFRKRYVFNEKDLFQKSALYTTLGIYVFFFVSSILKGHVEANWTVAAHIPLAIYLYYLYNENFAMVSYIKMVAIVTLILVLPIRLYLAINFLPESFNQKLQKHGWQSWANTIDSLAVSNKAQVVFMDSYQRTSMFEYLTGKKTTSIRNCFSRNNQFQLWPELRSQYMGKKVVLVHNWTSTISKVNTTFDKPLSYDVITYFNTLASTQVVCSIQNAQNKNTTFKLKFEIDSNEKKDVELSDIPKPTVGYILYDASTKKIIEETTTSIPLSQFFDYNNFILPDNLEKGNYAIEFFARYGVMCYGNNKVVPFQIM